MVSIYLRYIFFYFERMTKNSKIAKRMVVTFL